MKRRGFMAGLAGLPLLGFLSGEAGMDSSGFAYEMLRDVEPEPDINVVVDSRSLEEVMATDLDSCVDVSEMTLKQLSRHSVDQEISDRMFAVDVNRAVFRMPGETDDELRKRIKERLEDG